MDADTTTLTRAWAYVHNELGAADRVELERELLRDRDLRAAVERIRKLDAVLRDTLPALDWTEDELIDRTLAAWQESGAEQDDAPGRQAAERSFRHDLGLIFFGSVFRRTAVAVAAAAAILLLMAPPGTPGGGLQWQQPEFIAASFRGADGAQTASGYDADTAARCFALLRDAVAAHYRDLAPEGAGRFVLSFQLREMADRSFSVSLQARDGHGGDAGVWTGDYSGVEAFAAEADASAKRIAADLARRLSGGTRRVRDEI